MQTKIQNVGDAATKTRTLCCRSAHRAMFAFTF